MPERILIIEDDEDLAFGLRHNLEYEGYDVEVEETGEKGLRRVLEGGLDLVVLDVMLPDANGLELLASLRKSGDRTPVLVLSARGEELDKVRGLRLGADDYVTKPFRVLELIARVEAILRRARGGDLDPERGRSVYTMGSWTVDPRTRVVRRDAEEVVLTPKEFDLLVALLRRDGAAATRLDLLAEVWGHKGAVETRTVDTHVGELRRKLEHDPSKPEHILTVWKVGYRVRR